MTCRSTFALYEGEGSEFGHSLLRAKLCLSGLHLSTFRVIKSLLRAKLCLSGYEPNGHGHAYPRWKVFRDTQDCGPV